MSIYDEILAERDYQDRKWGHDADDRLNDPMDFVGYIAHYSTKWFTGHFKPYTADELRAFRKSLVNSATLAVAGVEYVDRLLSGENARPDVLKEVAE